MNFLKSININQKKNIKLYAEADTNPELPDLSFEEPEVPEEPDEPEVVEEPNTEEALDDMENLDFDGDGDSDTGEVTEEFDTEDPTLNEEIEDFDDSALGFMGEEENMFNNGADFKEILKSIDFGLGDIPVLNLDDKSTDFYKHGGFIKIDAPDGIRRVYNGKDFVGIGVLADGILRPKRTI